MPNIEANTHIAITGAAGLVGLNLVTMLVEQGYTNISALDKHHGNLAILKGLHPQVSAQQVDLAEPGPWRDTIGDAGVVIMLHAQIAAKSSQIFQRNNVQATEHVLSAVQDDAFLVHVSSSVVHSVADDAYVRTKRDQEQLVHKSGLKYCIIRPTLMFGWFDGKHLGWLGRFMERVPVFPIPGDGRFMRQPLYSRDLCRALITVMNTQPEGEAYDLTGPEEITYIDIIRSIRDIKRTRTAVVCVPYRAFDGMLRAYALFSKKPPFTSEQLAALVAGDMFEGVDMNEVFGFSPTPFHQALRETLCHPVYSKVILGSPH